MFDIGWSEIALIGLVAVIVLGPKEMPTAMRTTAKMVRKARQVFGDFQRQMDDVIQHEEIKEIKKALSDNGLTDFKQQVERELTNTNNLLADNAAPQQPKPGEGA